MRTKRSVEEKKGAKTNKVCPKCRQEFKGFPIDRVCKTCIETIPSCENCGIVLGAEYGYMESAVDFKGHTICGTCLRVLKKNKFLHMMTEGKFLFLNGKIKTLSKSEREQLVQRLIYDNLQ